MAPDPFERPFVSGSGRSDPAAASQSGDIVRFVVVPLAVTLLFAGGVYWMKQASSGRPARPAGPVVQVRLLTAPVTVTLAAPPIQPHATAPAERPAERPEPAPSQPSAAEPSPVVSETPGAAERLDTVAFAAPPDLLLDSVTAQFRRALSERLARFKRYPQDARRARVQGTAVVRVTIARDGGVGAVVLTSSAGDASLDREAVATVMRARPLPRIPAGLPDRMSLTIPIKFSLR